MRRLRWLAALVLGALAAPGAALALHKCVGADGKVSYSELPCAGGAKAATISGGSAAGSGAGAASAGGLTASANVTFYDVAGASYDAVLAGLRAGAAGPHFARADWRLSYDLRWRQGPGSCAVTDVRTTLQLGVRLPRWTPPPGAPGELVARWERFMAALKVHEEGHLENGRGAERETKAALAALSAPDCGILEARAKERFQRIIDAYNAKDAEYDRATGHGRTQGAVF